MQHKLALYAVSELVSSVLRPHQHSIGYTGLYAELSSTTTAAEYEMSNVLCSDRHTIGHFREYIYMCDDHQREEYRNSNIYVYD